MARYSKVIVTNKTPHPIQCALDEKRGPDNEFNPMHDNGMIKEILEPDASREMRGSTTDYVDVYGWVAAPQGEKPDAFGVPAFIQAYNPAGHSYVQFNVWAYPDGSFVPDGRTGNPPMGYHHFENPGHDGPYDFFGPIRDETHEWCPGTIASNLKFRVNVTNEDDYVFHVDVYDYDQDFPKV